MDNVLVIGAAGFIGLHMVRELTIKGYSVFALIRHNDSIGRAKLKAVNNSIVIYDNVSELMSKANILKPFKFIFNLATVGINPNFSDYVLLCDVNIKLACQIADIAKKNKSELLVHFGSCFEYGDHGDTLLNEDLDCKPESLYAITKTTATKLLMTYSKSIGLNMIVVRPFGVFGEGEDGMRLAPSIIRSCVKKVRIDTTRGQQVRDFVDVKDVSKSIVLLAESRYESYNIYNICSNYPVTVEKFIIEIINTCGFDASLVNFGALEYREHESMFYVGDNSKLQKVINYPFPDNHVSGILDIYNNYIDDGVL